MAGVTICTARRQFGQTLESTIHSSRSIGRGAVVSGRSVAGRRVDAGARESPARVRAESESWPEAKLDVGFISWGLPRAEFHAYLRRLVEAGFGRRVMFGSDQMI